MNGPKEGLQAHEARFLERVGSVPRWVRFKRRWHIDPDWLRHRKMQKVVLKRLGYQPSKQSTKVEKKRIGDYDRWHKPLDKRTRTLLAEALEWAKAHFASCKGRGVMSFEEAVEFVLKSDCADSSPGYPLNQKFKTKAEALANAEVLAEARAWIQKLGTREVLGVFFSLSLKDEILKTAKVEEDRTRLFMAAPLFHHLAMVMFCGKMHEAFINLKATWCSAGHDFHYGGWDAMMRELPFELFMAADAEMYDMTIGRELFDAVYQLVAEYVPEGGDALYDLFQMALDTPIVTSRGDVYYKFGGNPSGWYLTLFLNSVVMYLSIAMMWLDKHPVASTTRTEFESRIKAWVCGDDSLVCVHPQEESLFNEATWRDIWQRIGLVVKKIESSRDILQMEYCGAYSVMCCGKYCRKPRVQKFLDALIFTCDLDPLYRLQRAYSIYHELWTVPERAIVRGYIDLMVERYPQFAAKVRRYEKSEAQLAYLHAGVPAGYKQHGGSRNGMPAKSVAYESDTTDSLDTKSMPKTKAQKEARKAKKALARAELAKLAGKAASSAASAGAKAAEKKKKKGGGSFWGALAGAARMAAELAPTVAPLLLAQHAPTAQRAAMMGAAPQAIGGAVGLAAPTSCATCTGLYQTSALKGKDGRVIGMKMTGLDYVGSLSCNNELAGTVLAEIPLNPFDVAWAGTQLQRFATLFERYRPHRLAGLVEPSCPATTAGQILGYIDPDPDDEFTEIGRTALQVAASHQGADISQVWGMNCAAYAFDESTQDFYADADGSDERLISPGTWRVLANTDMPASTVIGSLYVTWEFTFKIPQIEEFTPGGLFRIWNDEETPPGTYPLGDPTSVKYEEGTLALDLGTGGDPVAYSVLSGLPVGQYHLLLINAGYQGTSLPAWTVTPDGAGNYTKGPGQSTFKIYDAFGSGSWSYALFEFVVQDVADDPDQGSLQFSYTCTGTASTNTVLCFLYQIKSTALSAKRRTLQQIEKDVQQQMQELKAAMVALQSYVAVTAAQSGGCSSTASGSTTISQLPAALFSSPLLSAGLPSSVARRASRLPLAAVAAAAPKTG